nr:hypothetical protein [uncultured Halomonas sp.]
MCQQSASRPSRRQTRMDMESRDDPDAFYTPEVRSRHVMELLIDEPQESPAHYFAEALLLREPDEQHPWPGDKPAFIDLALFGVSEDEWQTAVRAARLQDLLSQLSSRAPYVMLSKEAVESDGGDRRWQVWQGQSLRPGSIEHWYRNPVSAEDQQVLLEALALLPAGWSLVLADHGGDSSDTSDEK